MSTTDPKLSSAAADPQRGDQPDAKSNASNASSAHVSQGEAKQTEQKLDKKKSVQQTKNMNSEGDLSLPASHSSPPNVLEETKVNVRDGNTERRGYNPFVGPRRSNATDVSQVQQSELPFEESQPTPSRSQRGVSDIQGDY